MTSHRQSRDGAKDGVPSIFTGNQRLSTSSISSAGGDHQPSSSADAHGDVPTPLKSFRPRQPSLTAQSGQGDNPMSPDAADRVFPIRSVVSVAPTPAAASAEHGDSYFTQARRAGGRQPPIMSPSEASEASVSRAQFEDAIKDNPELQQRLREHAEAAGLGTGHPRPRVDTGGAQHSVGASGAGFQIQSDTRSEVSDGSRGGVSIPVSLLSGQVLQEPEEPIGLVTARFKHVVTDGGHAVITGRDGDTLQRCEDEPIHIPGAVQSFGALVAFQEEAEGKLVVRVVSENSKRVLGYTPRQLFNLESFTDILSEDQTDNLLDHIDFIKDEDTNVQANGPEVFTVSIRSPGLRRTHKLWCAIHMSATNENTIICEFELEEDSEYPLIPKHEEETPEPAEDTLNSQPTEEELRESTEARNKPLRVLRGARKRKGEAAAMEVFNIMSQVQEQLAAAPNLEEFLKVLVGVAKELTGFHRVMIYQFDQSFNGKVVTELVDPRATRDLYKGLHFPASDIPAQARNLYKINKVRLLYDRDHETARLVCRTVEDLESPLDLTHSYLRAMSPIHIKYLANMAVRSSMSISINAFNELWGLISCHTYGAKGMRVSFPIRKMCRLIGDSASRNIERLSYASRLQARKLINTSSTSRNPSGYIIASSDDLLSLFDADFGLLSIHDETKILGRLEATQEALALLEYLRMRKFQNVVTSQEIRFDFPDMRYQPGFQVIAGLLLVPLSTGGNDFIVFFRKGQLREVKWAGNPYEKFIKEGTEGYLEPRKSFKTWTETVVGKCREWSEEEMETAGVLCLVYGKFIEVWRQKEQALQNTQLTKLLLQNSAHEVRTPLNAIINYLEIALEGSLDQETRDNLAKSHSASKSLIYVINDLLDLTKTEASNQLVYEEAFDLRATFREAVDMFSGDAKRKNIAFEIVEDDDLPEKVLGDPRRVRQAISNITANAIEATMQGSVKASMSVASQVDESVDIEVVIEDTGRGMSSAELDKLFVELEQAQTENTSLIEEALITKPKSLSSGNESPQTKRTLGLGLAVVARIIRNMEGQLRLKSEEGTGSRFVIVFPFILPKEEKRPTSKVPHASYTSSSSATTNTEVPDTHGSQQGEMTLVAKATPRRANESTTPVGSPPNLSRQNSGGSLTSLRSGRSMASANSGKSDADRLIEAIQQPHMAESPPASSHSNRPSVERRRSKHSSVHWRQSGDVEPYVPGYLRTGQAPTHGVQEVKDSNNPLRALRMPDEAVQPGDISYAPEGSGRIELQDDRPQTQDGGPNAENLKVLVAEDDPINSKIIQKRLQKGGHDPFLTVNGEECASQYCDRPAYFDVVLMDMQMPIVDGSTSTKMIRSFEKSHPLQALSQRAALNGRIPIIAVSASLREADRDRYVEEGFDGWILKPISFARLGVLMQGIVDSKVRTENLYRPGEWEKGGWFHARKEDAPAAVTSPTERVPFSFPVESRANEGEASGTIEGGEIDIGQRSSARGEESL